MTLPSSRSDLRSPSSPATPDRLHRSHPSPQDAGHPLPRVGVERENFTDSYGRLTGGGGSKGQAARLPGPRLCLCPNGAHRPGLKFCPIWGRG